MIDRLRRDTRYEKRETRCVAATLAAATLAGCSLFYNAPPGAEESAPVNMQLLAVLPIEPVASTSADGTTTPPPPAEAGLSVTAQIYRVLADQTEFRFVPDLTVADELETPEVRRAGGTIERAVALGKEVGADGVIFGHVFRFQKRVGTEYGASEPASVGFDLGLVAVSSGAVVWQGTFDQTQEPLTSNLLNWWMFWREGPRWFSAGELAGLGVDRLFADLTASINRAG